MSLVVEYKKTSNPEEAFKAVSGELTEELFDKFNVKATVVRKQDQNKIEVTGKGFKVLFIFKDKNVSVDFELGLLLKAFKAKIAEQLERKLQKVV